MTSSHTSESTQHLSFSEQDDSSSAFLDDPSFSRLHLSHYNLTEYSAELEYGMA